MRSRLPSFLPGVLLVALAAPGCSGDAVDPRFRTPEATVGTLFAAYGVADTSEAEVVARLQAGVRFELVDPEAYRACFADFRRPEHEGLAGYVFGSLAAGKEHLRFREEGDRVVVLPTAREGGEAPRVVLRRVAGEYKISLEESVPPDVRERLVELYRRAREHEARRGVPR